MCESAEVHSAHITTNRNCTVEITNVSNLYCLVNPKVYMKRGFPHSPPQPTVRSQKTEVFSFTKNDNTASGAVGVFTYELFNMQRRYCKELVAVMFSVPFDYNIYANWLGVGFFEKDKPCDEELYEYMYNAEDAKDFHRHEADGSGVLHSSKEARLDVRATMSSEGRAIVKIEIYDMM